MKLSTAKVRRLAAQYPKYVEWSDEDGCFIGRCPQLFAGGVHGQREAVVYADLVALAEEWVEILHGDGTVLPKADRSGEYSGRFLVRMDPTLHQRLSLRAASNGESLNQWVVRRLAQAGENAHGCDLRSGVDGS